MRSLSIPIILGVGSIASLPSCVATDTPLKDFQLTCPNFWLSNNGLLGKCRGYDGKINSLTTSLKLDYCVEWNGTYLEPKNK